MKKNWITAALVIWLGHTAQAQGFTLKSHELGGQLTSRQYFNGMGYTGANQSPELYWEHAPAGTKSFAITVYDPDAPTGSGFWHWVVFNIPADIHELPAGAGTVGGNLLPVAAVQSNTDMGMPGYAGAAPTPGPAHRYIITVYALDKQLDLKPQASPAWVGFNIRMATLGLASLIVYGQR